MNRKEAGLNPLWRAQPDADCARSVCKTSGREHISDWAFALDMSVKNKGTKLARIALFGCTEDIECSCVQSQELHAEQVELHPFMRILCANCKVPICSSCSKGLSQYGGTSTIPMSLANDHYYGYVHKFLVDKSVTWLECAAASVC